MRASIVVRQRNLPFDFPKTATNRIVLTSLTYLKTSHGLQIKPIHVLLSRLVY